MLLTAVAPQFAIFGGPAPLQDRCPGRSPRQWWWDCRTSGASPRAEEEVPARATVELPRRCAAVRATSLHPTPPLAIHSPILMAEIFDVPRGPPGPWIGARLEGPLWRHCRRSLGVGFIPVLRLAIGYSWLDGLLRNPRSGVQNPSGARVQWIEGC
jgi:hypothetical protein